ncbi:hypothetical protein ACFS07_29665 [Undibacterium arcticum]
MSRLHRRQYTELLEARDVGQRDDLRMTLTVIKHAARIEKNRRQSGKK